MRRNVPSHITENTGYSRVLYKGCKYMKTPGGWQFWSDLGGDLRGGAYNKGGWVNLLDKDLSVELSMEFDRMVRNEKIAETD